jgi:hypothetical protein
VANGLKKLCGTAVICYLPEPVESIKGLLDVATHESFEREDTNAG